MQVIPKYYTILYKGLEHPQILVSTGVPGINPLWILKGDCTVMMIHTFMHCLNPQNVP